MYCRQYEITAVDYETSAFGPSTCYSSPFNIYINQWEIRVETDSLYLKFLIIIQTKRETPKYDRSEYFAVISGHPEQVYHIFIFRDGANNFFFGATPTKFTKKSDTIEGIALEVSNLPICK